MNEWLNRSIKNMSHSAYIHVSPRKYLLLNLVKKKSTKLINCYEIFVKVLCLCTIWYGTRRSQSCSIAQKNINIANICKLNWMFLCTETFFLLFTGFYYFFKYFSNRFYLLNFLKHTNFSTLFPSKVLNWSHIFFNKPRAFFICQTWTSPTSKERNG